MNKRTCVLAVPMLALIAIACGGRALGGDALVKRPNEADPTSRCDTYMRTKVNELLESDPKVAAMTNAEIGRLKLQLWADCFQAGVATPDHVLSGTEPTSGSENALDTKSDSEPANAD